MILRISSGRSLQVVFTNPLHSTITSAHPWTTSVTVPVITIPASKLSALLELHYLLVSQDLFHCYPVFNLKLFQAVLHCGLFVNVLIDRFHVDIFLRKQSPLPGSQFRHFVP